MAEAVIDTALAEARSPAHDTTALAGLQFLYAEFLYGVLDFNVNRMVHINAMIVWMLYGFIGAVYWLVEDEAGVELVGAKLANINFWVLTTPVAIVVVVYLLVQVAPASKAASGSSTRAGSTSRHRVGPTSASSSACWCSSTTSRRPS